MSVIEGLDGTAGKFTAKVAKNAKGINRRGRKERREITGTL